MNAVRDGIQTARDKADEATETARQKIDEATETARQKIDETTTQVQDAIAKATDGDRIGHGRRADREPRDRERLGDDSGDLTAGLAARVARIFLAGASGAIGRPLTRMLVAAGHEVTGTSRTETGAATIEAAGATAAIVDVFDAAAVAEAMRRARPEVVIYQVTDLSMPDGRGADRREARGERARSRGRHPERGEPPRPRSGRGGSSPRASAGSTSPGPEPHTEDDPIAPPPPAVIPRTRQAVIDLERRRPRPTRASRASSSATAGCTGPGTWKAEPDEPPTVHVEARRSGRAARGRPWRARHLQRRQRRRPGLEREGAAAARLVAVGSRRRLMGRLVYSMSVSLDGFAAAPTARSAGSTSMTSCTRISIEEASRDECLPVRPAHVRADGRLLADGGDGPGGHPEMVDFGRIWTATPKIVFSSTLDRGRLEQPARAGDAVAEVARLKAGARVRHGCRWADARRVTPARRSGGRDPGLRAPGRARGRACVLPAARHVRSGRGWSRRGCSAPGSSC